MSLQTTHHDKPPVVSTPLNTLRDESDADYGHEQRISTEDSVQEGHSQDEAMNPRSSPSEGPKFSKMASPEARFSTYDSWHLRKMHPPEKLAEAGFFYLEDGSSKVACFYSGMTITVNAGSYADPLEEHARCCHDCPFLLADHQKGPVLLQGTSEGTLKTRGPGKSKEADTQKTPETVRAPEQSSSQQFGTDGLAPTPSTNNSLGSTSKASGQHTIVTASSTCKQNEGKNLAVEPRATDQLALSCNDAAAPEAFYIQQAEIQSRAETTESTGGAEKVSSKATASEAPDEIIRAKNEQLAALAALKAKEEGVKQCPGNTFQTLASGVVENIEEGSEKHKDIVSACVGSDKSEDILVSRHGANSTEFQADTNPETERYVTEGNLCIPPLATDDPYGQQLSTGAYKSNDQQTGDTPASSKKASDKNIEDTHSNTGGVVKDITVSRTAVGGQHGAASSPTVTNQTRHEAVGTAIEKNVQCTDFYISSPATSLLHKDKLTVQNGQMCTEESPAGMVFDEQGIETAGASSLVSGAYADDFFKLPIQEQGESNTNSTSSTMNTARWQENHPPSPLGKREEDAGLSDTQKAKDSEPIYVTSDDKLWHPKCPLSTGVQPDASTICGRQQRISQKDHHQETCAVQVSVNSAIQQEKPVSMQHTHSCNKHDQSEAARTQPSGSMPHHDSTQKHIASSHPQAPESALCSLNYLQERKDDAVPENWEDNNDSESDDEQAEDDLGTGGGGSSGDGNGDDDENHDGNDNNSGDGDEDEDDESDDGNDSSSSEDDGAEGAAPQDLIGYIYAGVDIDIREATLPCLHCRVAEKQVQLPCSHRNLCFKCFFCKQFWRQHLLHGPPRCLLCEEEFTDIDDPFVFLLALAFNRRRQRRTNCGCGYRGG